MWKCNNESGTREKNRGVSGNIESTQTVNHDMEIYKL